MSYFAVTREHGPAFDSSRPLEEQDAWPEHAAFMDGLVDDGFIIVGGPLSDGPPHVLLIVDADSERAIRDRLAADPWVPMDMLRIVSIQAWQIRLGEDPAAQV